MKSYTLRTIDTARRLCVIILYDRTQQMCPRSLHQVTNDILFLERTAYTDECLKYLTMMFLFQFFQYLAPQTKDSITITLCACKFFEAVNEVTLDPSSPRRHQSYSHYCCNAHNLCPHSSGGKFRNGGG
jgi:hypothetical protein